MLLSLVVLLVIGLPHAFLEAVDADGGGIHAQSTPAAAAAAATMRSLRGDVVRPGETSSPATALGGGKGEDAAGAGGGSPYVILCDAGSTGTRLYVYRRRTPSEIASSPDGKAVDIQVGSKVKPGLASQTPHGVAAYLRPSLLEAAARMIPPEYHSSTPVVVYATAGMRLLPEEAEREIYDGLVEGLRNDPDVPFAIERENFKTIPGDDEGYFAALAVNYLAGRVGADLTPTSGDAAVAAAIPAPLLGALDLGGASAQVVFPLDSLSAAPLASSSAAQRRLGEPLKEEMSVASPRPLGRDDFFSASLLGYGGDQIRHKLDAFVAGSGGGRNRRLESTGPANGNGGDSAPVSNPCYFKGYKATLDGIPHVGTGNAALCLKHVEAVMAQNPPENGDDIPKDMHGKHFYAMTLYYYVIDFARDVLGNLESRGASTLQSKALQTKLAVPNPPVSLLRDAAAAVCSWDFQYLSQPAVASAYDDFAGPDNMPHRCMEFTYVTALLRRLGLSDPDGADVRFVDTVGGESVEWTLGAFLHLSNGGEQRRLQQTADASGGSKGKMFFAAALAGWALVAHVLRRHLRSGRVGGAAKCV